MSRLLCALALSPLLLLTPSAARSADEKLLTSAYFPMEVGTTWHYRVGEARFKVKVTKHEKIGGVMAARLETFGEKDKLISSEHVAVTSDTDGQKIVRVASQNKPLTPPVPFLKVPPKKDQSWKIDSKLEGQVIRGVFKIRSTDENVKVTAGTYKTVVVEGQDLEVIGNKLSLSYQFAEKVGLVKQTMELAGQKIVVELEKFEPAK
jgi:hypothetical protein